MLNPQDRGVTNDNVLCSFTKDFISKHTDITSVPVCLSDFCFTSTVNS